MARIDKRPARYAAYRGAFDNLDPYQEKRLRALTRGCTGSHDHSHTLLGLALFTVAFVLGMIAWAASSFWLMVFALIIAWVAWLEFRS